MLQEIGRYFAVPLSAVKSDDWDAVEKTVKQVIKSSRAGANFQAN
jgi:ATP-dependent RNA helicase DDX19/DBP5